MAERRTETSRVLADLTKRIRDGKWGVDEAIPSTTQLTDHYRVSRTVVRDAINALKAANIVAGQPGKGVYVIAVPGEEPPDTSIADLMAEVRGLRAQVDALSEPTPAHPDEDLRDEVEQIRRLVGALQTHLIDLYGRLGQPYPYEGLPAETESMRRSS